MNCIQKKDIGITTESIRLPNEDGNAVHIAETRKNGHFEYYRLTLVTNKTFSKLRMNLINRKENMKKKNIIIQTVLRRHHEKNEIENNKSLLV